VQSASAKKRGHPLFAPLSPDFERLFVFTCCSAFFVVRTRRNVVLQRRYSHAVDRSTGVRSDQTVILAAPEPAEAYPDPLRRFSCHDAKTNKRLRFLTNNFTHPAGADDCRDLPLLPAGGVVLSLDPSLWSSGIRQRLKSVKMALRFFP
jgi:hypothetical protein